jgi:hypothetical protein
MSPRVGKKILIAIVVFVAVMCIVIATRPDSFRAERSAEINAPPAIVFNQVNDFSKWQAWSPWAKLDPNVKLELSANPVGKGATYKWEGNDDVGSGAMTILESTPAEKVDIDLHFLKPFEAKNKTVFTFKGDANKTTVTWAMEGHNNFVTKAFSMFVNMDEMVGKDFEKGLAQMKTVSEAEAQAQKAAAEAQAKADAEAAAAAAAQQPEQATK